MFAKAIGTTSKTLIRSFSSGAKVAILGAAGGIGQPLSMMMTVNPYVSTLSLYDLANSPGVAVDLSHINSKCKVNGYKGPKELKEALEGANMVIVSAGLPRKPGMTRDDLFMVNAGISLIWQRHVPRSVQRHLFWSLQIPSILQSLFTQKCTRKWVFMIHARLWELLYWILFVPQHLLVKPLEITSRSVLFPL